MDTRHHGADIGHKQKVATFIEQANILARDKGLGSDVVLSALEKAFAKVMESKYGTDHFIRVSLSQTDGLRTFLTPKPTGESNAESEENCVVPVEKEEFLPFPEFDRGDIKTLRSVLSQSLQAANRAIVYEEFKNRVGQIVSGSVKQIARDGSVYISLGRGEGLVSRKDMIPGEHFSVGARIKVCIADVKKDGVGDQIVLSRTHNDFLRGIMAQEIPEIHDRTIEIRAIARDPGSRAKVAVSSNLGKSDTVGACIGTRGNRIRAVSDELGGEKIDVVLWSSNMPSLVVDALSPAEISRVIVEDEDRLRVVVPQDHLGSAIGRSGQNVRLARKLTGVGIEIITGEEYEKEHSNAAEQMQTLLDLDDVMARFLVLEGFKQVSDLVGDTTAEDLASLEGMNLDIAHELQRRANDALVVMKEKAVADFVASGGQRALVDDVGVPFEILPTLAKNDVLTVRHFADLSIDELLYCVGGMRHILSEDQWGDLIMKGRDLCG
jgi:N utilization substance protein A